MTTKELIYEYYQRLSEKGDWVAVISDDFHFKGVGGNTQSKLSEKGKLNYIDTIDRFYEVFVDVAIKYFISDKTSAFVIANYDLISPQGNTMSFDIVELWTVHYNKLDSLEIFFDTATWNKFFGK